MKTLKLFIKEFKYPLSISAGLIGAVALFQNAVIVNQGQWIAITNLKNAQPYSTGGLLVNQAQINPNNCEYRIRIASSSASNSYGTFQTTGIASATSVTATTTPVDYSAKLNFSFFDLQSLGISLKCPNGSAVVYPPGSMPASVILTYGSPASSNTSPLIQLYASAPSSAAVCGGGMGIALTPSFYNANQVSYAAVERRCHTKTVTPTGPIPSEIPSAQ